MPFTPYHFGPSGLIGFAFRKWLDLPVLILANVIVDIEVLIVNHYDLGWPIHRIMHSIPIGGVVGLVWGLVSFLLFRPVFRLGMSLMQLEYKPKLISMLVSGVLGVWLHAILDAFYHWDVRLFRPFIETRTRWNKYFTQEQIKILCWVCITVIVLWYLIYLFRRRQGGSHHFNKNSRS